jgi:hypothetical protein
MGAGVTPVPEEEVRRRQRERAKVMGLLLGAFALLLFFITMAKIAVNQ